MPKPRKADVQRLQKLVDSWNEEERNLQSHYGPAESGSMRSSRIKDAEALASVLVHVTGEDRFIYSKDLYELLQNIQNGIRSPADESMANGLLQQLDKLRSPKSSETR